MLHKLVVDLLTGGISIGRFPSVQLHDEPFFTFLQAENTSNSAWCAVTVEGDRNRDLGSPH